MKENSVFLKKLTAEESCVVSGGASTPTFVVTSTEDTRSGKILNADGHGNSINFSGSENTNDANSIDVLQLALPAPMTTTQTKVKK